MSVTLMPLHAGANGLDSLAQGQEAFNEGNYALSFAIWQTLARKGDSNAQIFVGLSYANGWGVAKDLSQAAYWYESAARQQNPSAQSLLGFYYLVHRQDMRETGMKWLLRAANNGDQQARDFLNKGASRGWFKDIETVNSARSGDAALGPLALAPLERDIY
jgi:TPR repeat protein